MMQLPKDEKSYWRESYPATASAATLYPALKDDITVDVVIVGAGITGLTTAYLLKQSGLTVAVIEKHTVGGGTTGRTTGKVSSQHNLVYAELQKRLGTEAARIYGAANQAAVAQIAKIIQQEKIACDWQIEDNYVFTTDPQKVEQLKKETKVAAELGLPASFETTTPLPFDILGAVKFTDQAKFNSQKYLLGLAKAVHGNGSFVFENSTAIGIRDGSSGRVKTTGGSVRAKNIVVASSVPTMPLLARGAYSILEYPMESYIVAGRIDKGISGMYISPDKAHYSILPIETNGQREILIGGQAHFWGLRGNRTTRFQKLADYAHEHFGVTEITHRWSDRDYLAYDNVPLVGKLYPWSKHLYVATAFKKWGLSNGTAAAMILNDLLQGHDNPWVTTFRSLRTSPITSMPHTAMKLLKGKV